MALRAGICGAVRRSVRPSLTRASATTRTGSGLPAWRSLGIAASDVLRPEPHLTHEVVNQSVPFTDYNAFDSDRVRCAYPALPCCPGRSDRSLHECCCGFPELGAYRASWRR